MSTGTRPSDACVTAGRATARPSWEFYALGIAKAVSARADCTRRQVGAVILDTRNRVASTGYNGAPPGERGCLEGGCPRGLLSYQEQQPYRGYENCISNHAEVNALLYADRSRIEGGTMYVTDLPCIGCSKVIANSGLVSVVYRTRVPDSWAKVDVKELKLHA